ncbi:MAG: hypothetical protein COA50_15100 [Flavobacteriaceae bacterium]|nr:MAG: hypothetical protein COA50_15100 [Flavobacteriaceae bacterium]
MDPLADIAEEILLAVRILEIVLLIFLLFKIYTALVKSKRMWIIHAKGQGLSKILKIGLSISILLLLICTLFFFHISSEVKPFIPTFHNQLLVALIFVFLCLEMYLSLSMSKTLVAKTNKKIILGLLVLILLPLSIVKSLQIPNLFNYPPKSDCYSLILPVKGVWLAGHAGGSVAVNHHQPFNGQKYGMEEKVYAPISGKVVQAIDSLPNAPINLSPMDTINPAGNHVVIEIEPNRYLFLAHLNTGTVTVKRGDMVKAGDFIGEIGNSGNTSMPHLHMHIQNLPLIEFKNSIGYPYRFAKMKRKRWWAWKTVADEFLVRNDLFNAQ